VLSGAQCVLRQAFVKTAGGLAPRKGTKFPDRVSNYQCHNKEFDLWNDAGYCINKVFPKNFD